VRGATSDRRDFLLPGASTSGYVELAVLQALTGVEAANSSAVDWPMVASF
jgi:hypothetical protein